MSDQLLPTLKKLRLSGLAESLEIRLHEAATSGLNHREFLELVLKLQHLPPGLSEPYAIRGIRRYEMSERWWFIPSSSSRERFHRITSSNLRRRQRSGSWASAKFIMTWL